PLSEARCHAPGWREAGAGSADSGRDSWARRGERWRSLEKPRLGLAQGMNVRAPAARSVSPEQIFNLKSSIPQSLNPNPPQQLRLINHLDPQTSGLLQLAPRLFSRDEDIGLLAHAAGHVSPGLFDQERGLLAAQGGQGPSQHIGLAAQRAIRCDGAGLDHREPRPLQPLDERAIARLGKEA